MAPCLLLNNQSIHILYIKEEEKRLIEAKDVRFIKGMLRLNTH